MAWTKGQSGNPNGRPKGKLDKIRHALVKDMHLAWRQYGPEALAMAAKEFPAQFVAAYVKLLPKDTHIDIRHDLSDRFIAAIRNAALPTTSGAGTIIDMTADKPDDDKPLITLDTQRSKDIP